VKTKLVPIGWIDKEGRRLDCGPYLSGAIETKLLLEKLPTTKLHQLTLDGKKGIYHAGRESRTWVDDPTYGIPFMSGSDTMLADLSRLPLISKGRVAAVPKFIVRKGWTLITRSGTVGRMVYCRPDMDGYACSEDVLRVLPDESKVPPGYLYAFLASRYGVPMVVGGTYGAIIQHIEPEHIWDLPVLRVSGAAEAEANDLMQRATALRVQAGSQILRARSAFSTFFDGIGSRRYPQIGLARASNLLQRLDAAYHEPTASEVESRIRAVSHTTIGDFCSQVFLPGIFKRIPAKDIQYGAPYFLGMSLFSLEPLPKGILSRRSTLFEDVLLKEGTVLVQAFGQEGGLIGRLAWVGRHLNGSTTTHMLVRLRAADLELTGYLWAFLDSEAGYALVRRLPYGGSIPHLDETFMRRVPIPLMKPDDMKEISTSVLQALKDRDVALELEWQARRIVEQFVEGAQ
jgi:type I restriction enzyme S subunit